MPSPPPYNDDIEAASQQLLAENQPTNRQPDAVRGANLLNAARQLAKPLPAERRTQMAHAGKLKPGKLKRVSLPGDRSRQSRGVRVYNLSPSPHKRASLPAQIIRREQDRREDALSLDEMEEVVPETSQVESEKEQPIDVPVVDNRPGGNEDRCVNEASETASALPVTSELERPHSATKKPRGRPPKRKSAASAASVPLSDAGAIDVTEDGTSIPSEKPGPDAHDNDGRNPPKVLKHHGDAPVRKKVRRLGGWKAYDPETVQTEEDITGPAVVTQENAHPGDDREPEIRMPIRSTRLRDAQGTNSHDTKTSKSTSNPTKRQPRRKAASLEDKTVNSETIDDVKMNVDILPASQQLETPAKDESEHDEATPSDGNKHNDEDHGEHNGVNEVLNSAVLPPTEEHANLFPALYEVSKFKNSTAHPGVCSTNLGRSIYRACDEMRTTLEQPGVDLAIEDITKCGNRLTNLPRIMGNEVAQKRRATFKEDAFGYLFHALVVVFMMLHDKLQEREGNTDGSLIAMKILYTFARDMLRFKDAIDAWKVKVPQRKHGEGLIKHVESGLIAPLRVVEKKYQMQLRLLQTAKESRETSLNHRRQLEERYAEQSRLEEASDLRRNRRQRWQDLHIVRMQCEPDPSRRRRLRFVEPVEGKETDANGDEFERVPFLGARSVPPPPWIITSDKEWTTEEETVLLESLQSSEGLEHIFKTYCCPGGALRDFTVVDIALKMTWVRSRMLQLYQQHGWDIPEWVTKIPVLP